MFRPKRPRGRDQQNVQVGARFRDILVLDGVLARSDQRVLSTWRTNSSNRNGSAECGGGCSRRPRSENGRNARRSIVAVGETISDFRQQEPYEGQPATERTEVRILYSRHAVYFGIHCFDSDPSRIIASELRRDVSQDLDDHFEILIDSNHDRRGAYVFEINPLGTQSDGLVVEEQGGGDGGDFDRGWDGVWTSEARIATDGWTATIEIPLDR